MKTYRSNSLTIEEQEQLLLHTRSNEDLILLKLALQTGIRREDIVGIEVGNVDLEARKITFWEAKKKRHWVIPITKEMVYDLQRFINGLPKGQRKLFTFTGRTAYNILQRTLERANIKKDLSFHDLRRSFVKTAKKKGLSPKAVAQITGDTLKVIQEHYENLDHEELKEEVDKL